MVLAIAKDQGYSLYSLSFDYGQRHRYELEAARKVSQLFRVKKHLILPIDLAAIGGSALTTDIDVPKKRTSDEIERGIPVTYVPARNTILLSLSLAWAETLKTGDIYIGAHTLDYSGYPDCRPEYFDAFTCMANLATKAGVEGSSRIRIHTPLLSMNKTEIIQRGIDLDVPFELTISCYQPDGDGRACGVCDSCLLRRRACRKSGYV